MEQELEKFKQLTTEQALADPLKLGRLYQYFFGGEVCLSCREKLKNYVQKLKNLELSPMKKEVKPLKSSFVLRSEITTLQMDFGSSIYFNNDTLTDDLALQYLRINPKRIANFSHFPENWQTLLKEEDAPKEAKKKK